MGSKKIMDTPKIAIVFSAGHIITENTNCFPAFFVHTLRTHFTCAQNFTLSVLSAHLEHVLSLHFEQQRKRIRTRLIDSNMCSKRMSVII